MKKTKKNTKPKTAAKPKKAARTAPAANNRELVVALKLIAGSLAQINKSLQYLEDIASEVESIGADTEIMVSQYMGEGDQTETIKGTKPTA
jgi:hypothetical protein